MYKFVFLYIKDVKSSSAEYNQKRLEKQGAWRLSGSF